MAHFGDSAFYVSVCKADPDPGMPPCARDLAVYAHNGAAHGPRRARSRVERLVLEVNDHEPSRLLVDVIDAEGGRHEVRANVYDLDLSGVFRIPDGFDGRTAQAEIERRLGIGD